MKNKKNTFLIPTLLAILFVSFGCKKDTTSRNIVETVNEVLQAVQQLEPGDTLFLADGVYKDIQLSIYNSGTENNPIVICALNRGKVFFSGDVKVELKGEYLVLDGIYFKDGNRNRDEWESHGPGMVAIYGSHNRITQCAFHAFDQANSAYVTTTLNKLGKAPQHCRIDHCSFTEKITFDQVINLNNKTKEMNKIGDPGIPMYHRIDHCYFANPKKQGNAGGGIRVGYWRTDLGRCLIDHNLFERQDSEAEIITSKSMENVYYNNTYKNCAGTMNFRHGDKQVAINNFFIGTDTMNEYGGMFVWGSNHIIANNYFYLPTTLKSRGNAALYLNCGAVADEHALAYDIKILNNYFDQNNGYAINFRALYERRVPYCANKGLKFELPRDLEISNNLFAANENSSYPFFFKPDQSERNIQWKNNLAFKGTLGTKIDEGITLQTIEISQDINAEYTKYLGKETSNHNTTLYNIEGIDLDIPTLVAKGLKGKPITWNEVGPDWLEEIPGTYAKTGKLAPEIQKKFDEVTAQRK